MYRNLETRFRLSDERLNIFIEFLMEESGAPLIEYALIASLVAVVSGLMLLAFNKNN